MKKVAFYGRYSSQMQTEQSIEGQLHVCEKFAAQNDMEIVEQYVDRAATGTNDKRPEFQRMISDSASGKFECVLVYKLDRFARNRYDSAHYKKKLKDNGVRLISATENISESPEGILMEAMLEGWNEYYSEELSMKCKRGLQESFNKGYFIGGFPPYGYKVVDRRLALDEPKVPLVKEIYQRFADGERYTDILQSLKKRGIKNNWGHDWSFTNISTLLHSRIYIGEYKVGSMEGVMPCPAIIEKEVFDKVQKNSEIFRQRRRERVKTNGYLLSGKLRCGHCGHAVCGTGNNKRNRKYFYYHCQYCKYCVRAIFLEEEVLNALREYLTEEKISVLASAAYAEYQKEDTLSGERGLLEQELAKVERQIQNGIKAVLNGMDSSSFKDTIKELEQQRDELRKKLDEISCMHPVFTEEEFHFMLTEIVEKANNAENAKALIDTVVNRIIIHEKKAIICINLTEESNEPPMEQILLSLNSPSGRTKNTADFS